MIMSYITQCSHFIKIPFGVNTWVFFFFHFLKDTEMILEDAFLSFT